jgi:hypothetical protein
MSAKYRFISLLMLVMTAGCTMLDQQSPPDVKMAPPYWQSQNRPAQSQFAEMRSFHEKESAQMSEEMHRFHNHEIERLQAAGKEWEKDKSQQQNNATTQDQKEKWSWFKKKSKDTKKETPEVSSRLDEVNKNIR